MMSRSQILRTSLRWTYLNSQGKKASVRVFLYRMFPRTYLWFRRKGWVSELWDTRPYAGAPHPLVEKVNPFVRRTARRRKTSVTGRH